ncbi:MAG: 8-amino-7-oxononanoate synthase [Arenimonas sp.]
MSRIRLIDRIMAARAERTATATLRPRRVIEARDGVKVAVDGKVLMNFCSNDYLGLSQHLDVVTALQAGAAYHGVGSGSSALVCGHHQEHAALEREAAEWMEYPKALFLGGGYIANLAVLQSLLDNGDVCVQDRLNHASLIDGARLSGCELKRYPHGDSEAALRQLMSERKGAAMLATDGVFSMDGDLAPLRDLAVLARSQDALLYVDDAHGVGVIGEEGRGSIGVLNLTHAEVPLLLAPLGKAFGGQGALLFGSEAVIGHIAETARPYLFSTAPSPAMAAAMRTSLRLVRAEPWRRAKLMSLVMRFRRTALRAGLPLRESYTPIQPIVVGDNRRALAASAALQERGFLVGAIRPPTVANGEARLRVTLSALHGEKDVDALVGALATVCLDPKRAEA